MNESAMQAHLEDHARRIKELEDERKEFYGLLNKLNINIAENGVIMKGVGEAIITLKTDVDAFKIWRVRVVSLAIGGWMVALATGSIAWDYIKAVKLTH